MSITDELREYVQDWRDTPSLMDGLDRGDVDGILEDFIRIADRIDEQHRKALEKIAAIVDEPLADGPREKDNAISDRIEELERRVCVITENLDWALRFMDQTERRVSVLERKLNHRG